MNVGETAPVEYKVLKGLTWMEFRLRVRYKIAAERFFRKKKRKKGRLTVKCTVESENETMKEEFYWSK